jgi:hypothetical protein
MHYIELNEEAIKHLPEGFDAFSAIEENDYFYLENTDLVVAYDWDYDSMSEELIDNLNKFDLAKVLTKVLKFCDSFEFAYGGYSGSNFFEYFHFNGKKLTHVYGDFADLVDNEDYDEAYTDLENSIRFEGELSSEFLDGVNDIISEGNSYGLAFYDLKGNKIN